MHDFRTLPHCKYDRVLAEQAFLPRVNVMFDNGLNYRHRHRGQNGWCVFIPDSFPCGSITDSHLLLCLRAGHELHPRPPSRVTRSTLKYSISHIQTCSTRTRSASRTSCISTPTYRIGVCCTYLHAIINLWNADCLWSWNRWEFL